MSLLQSVLGVLTGKQQQTTADANPIVGALSSLINQNGGLQGLMGKFMQNGQGDAFSSWVGMGENHEISPDQIHQAIGSDQVQALASKMGIDPQEAAHFLSEYLPKVVDKLTPNGQVDPNADHTQGLAAMLPSLLSTMAGAGK
jgi:uncharacterized protein YidB (DUF937 family)